MDAQRLPTLDEARVLRSLIQHPGKQYLQGYPPEEPTVWRAREGGNPWFPTGSPISANEYPTPLIDAMFDVGWLVREDRNWIGNRSLTAFVTAAGRKAYERYLDERRCPSSTTDSAAPPPEH